MATYKGFNIWHNDSPEFLMGYDYTEVNKLHKGLQDKIAELEDLAQMIIDAESADPRVISLMYNAWLHKAKSLKEQE